MSVKVTLHRTYFDGRDPITRTFENAKYWEYSIKTGLVNLRVMGNGEGYDLLAEFAADAVESVEFISRESKVVEMSAGGTVTIKQSRGELFTPITAEDILDTVSRKEIFEAWETIKTRPLFKDNFGKYCGPDCTSVGECAIAEMNALLKKN